MQTALLVIHIVLAIVMIAVVLVQKSEGGALGMGGSSGGFMTTRGTANLLTRTTAVLAACFFLSTLGLALAFKGGQKTSSVLDAPDEVRHEAPMVPGAPAPAAAPAPVAPLKADAATPAPAKEEAAPVKEAQAPAKQAKKQNKKTASKKAAKDKDPS
ncbi:MAG: preprotein translocase subunit SecG [Candidatus Puniceispirillum sp.]|nr:preprotein translocase subunit SecG [Candidatus Puniceispirillum sp.]